MSTPHHGVDDLINEVESQNKDGAYDNESNKMNGLFEVLYKLYDL